MSSSTIDRYNDTVDYLYNCTPQFQLIGAGAYKPGLDTARELDAAFDHPHTRYRTIHIAGTNGKGSTAHTLAAILQSAGYKVGLYTSPHLADFRERIRVNGEMISHEGVIDFVDRYRAMTLHCQPSFFELTTLMAFDWFARRQVDVAVIETGLGGRLDTTNIITPVLSVITNISFDHTAQLGNTLKAIAGEKAGIIKANIPVVIGEAPEQEVRDVFNSTAKAVGTTICHADMNKHWSQSSVTDAGNMYIGTRWGDIRAALSGECQTHNAATILEALGILEQTFTIPAEAVRRGFREVTTLTSLMGRWMVTSYRPTTICDTGHNTGGWAYTSRRLADVPRPLSMVIGFVSDKDVDHILDMMPRDATYYFTRASIPRAMDADTLARKAAGFGLHGTVVLGVKNAVENATRATSSTGTVFIGGSTFVVADYLSGK